MDVEINILENLKVSKAPLNISVKQKNYSNSIADTLTLAGSINRQLLFEIEKCYSFEKQKLIVSLIIQMTNLKCIKMYHFHL